MPFTCEKSILFRQKAFVFVENNYSLFAQVEKLSGFCPLRRLAYVYFFWNHVATPPDPKATPLDLNPSLHGSSWWDSSADLVGHLPLALFRTAFAVASLDRFLWYRSREIKRKSSGKFSPAANFKVGRKKLILPRLRPVRNYDYFTCQHLRPGTNGFTFLQHVLISAPQKWT